ncbi:hypothetical protein GOP47_0008248 [Adiantum capillus-veneris]|uniref:Uncharacterized protein n=1 Tax=Adiantum capillus-veneris TaxID=13818 RepID=A0A9D4UY71_ADICA|nr:hypothetical protein GOP47_0008248 [Adiantum capillus-veneris]
MPLFRCSCILGGRCNQIKADEDIPEITSNNQNRTIDGTSEGINVVNENEMEHACLALPAQTMYWFSLSLGMMVHRPGILIHRDLILTSHGNLPNFDAAVDGEFVLCYLPSSRRRRSIRTKTILTRQLEPHRCFLTSEALDLTLVACEAVPENITEIIPLSIHQHLGSMDLLEEGHQVYVLGHLQSNELKGILASGTGCTTVFPLKDTSSNTLVAFTITREPKQGMNGLWMPGSAGFDDQGEFSFMVARPQLSSTSNNSNANTAQEPSFKRKSLENTTSSNIAQYGVPLYVIQDWMLMHGIRDLDNLPPPIQLSTNASNAFTPTTGSRSMDGSPLIPHGSLPLSDRNSINYVVMNASRLMLESQPRRNSSPSESFISYEPTCVGNETPLQITSAAGLGLHTISATKVDLHSHILKEKSFELPIGASTGEGNNGEPVFMQNARSTRDFQRSISESVTSRPLKWHSRTSLPPSYKTNCDNARDYEWFQNDEKTILAFPKFGLNQDKEFNIEELQARLSSSGLSHAPLQHEQYSDLDSGHGSAPIVRQESNHDDSQTTLTGVDVDEQIYEEITLETPKSMMVVEFTTDVDETKQLNAIAPTSSSDDFRIKEANDVSSRKER